MHSRAKQSNHRERPSTAPATLVDNSTEEEDGPLQPTEIYYDDDTQKMYYRVSKVFVLFSYLGCLVKLEIGVCSGISTEWLFVH